MRSPGRRRQPRRREPKWVHEAEGPAAQAPVVFRTLTLYLLVKETGPKFIPPLVLTVLGVLSGPFCCRPSVAVPLKGALW